MSQNNDDPQIKEYKELEITDDDVPIVNLTSKDDHINNQTNSDVNTTHNDTPVVEPAERSEDTPHNGNDTNNDNSNNDNSNNDTYDDTCNDNVDNESLSVLLEKEKTRSSEFEQKLRLALADYQNLSKRTASDIDNRVMQQTRDVMTSLVDIRDDFIRARDAFTKNNIDVSGLDSVLRNMDSVLGKYEVRPIDALGEIFDPNTHEAISTQIDPTLDDNTVIQEVRRGYTFRNTIIRPTMVVISKKE